MFKDAASDINWTKNEGKKLTNEVVDQDGADDLPDEIGLGDELDAMDSESDNIGEDMGYYSETQEIQNNSDIGQMKNYSGTELLHAARTSYLKMADMADSKENAERIKELCQKISENVDCDDEVEPTGGLLPEYQYLMNENGYEDEEEMCNSEGLNWDEIYDNEPAIYGDEYKRGFIDCIDEGKSPYFTSEDECSEAYNQGLMDAEELQGLIEEEGFSNLVGIVL